MPYKIKHQMGIINNRPTILAKDLRDIANKKDNVVGVNRIKLLPAQSKFVFDTHPEVLFSAGVGNGKSIALCIALLQKAIIPGNVCLLIRKTLTDLKASTLRILTEPEGTRQPILPPGSYTWNKTDKLIELKGGGTIYYTGCDDPMKIRSVNAGDIFIDECSQLDKEEYDELKMRLRVDVGKLQLMAVTNPANKNHWLYKRFVLENEPYRSMIYGSSLENIYLPQQTLDHLKTFKGSTYERMVEGKWIALDKMIYKIFDSNKNTTDFTLESIKENITDWWISIDLGWTNPSAMILAGIDKNGKIYIVDEFEKSQQLINRLGFHISNWAKNAPSPNIICDPSAAQIINELKAKGYQVEKAPNEVESGIALVQSLFEEGGLVISKNCINTIKSIESYSRDDFGKPIKKEEHLADCVRYLVGYLALRRAQIIGSTTEFYVPNFIEPGVVNKENDFVYE